MRGAVLITGVSSGIGRACAVHLARRGFRVFGTVRREEDVESLRAEAVREGLGDRLSALRMDVGDSGSVRSAAAGLAQQLGSAGLRAVVNNAGIGVVGPIECVSDDDWRTQFQVNVIGAVAVTRECLPMLRAYGASERAVPRAGRIVMMSSVAGRVAQPILGPYSASKFALEAISDSLRIELRSQPVAVSVIEPGAVKSEIWRKGEEGARKIGGGGTLESLYGGDVEVMRAAAAKSEAGAIPALKVAEAVERCIVAPKPPTRIVLGRDARTATLAKRWLPTLMMDSVLIRAFGLSRQRRG